MIYLLVIYFLYLLLFGVYSFLGVYHLWRFGYIGDLTKPTIATYVVVSASVIILSFVLIATRSWPVDFNL